MLDILIIGSGPAGLTAAVYARRANKTVLVLERESAGGQITHSPKVENYPGFGEISGNDLASRMLEQAKALGAQVEQDECRELTRENGVFTAKCDFGSYTARSVIIATGSKHRVLGLEREEELTGNGVSYCAVCDGAFYAGQDVVVIGGGNSALQDALLLCERSSFVTVVQNLDFLTGEEVLCRRLAAKKNCKVIYGCVAHKLVGDEYLTAIEIRNEKTGEITSISTDGVFVAIGQQPDNAVFEKLAELDSYGYIKAGEDCLTSTGGVFAAGDCRTKRIRQVTTATADGAVAAIAACRYIDSLSDK